MRRIAVIGGGPAGFMAAIAAAKAARAGASVTVFDAAIPLATVLRTGGGRCNITNSAFETRELAGCYPRGGKLLLSIFSRFGPVAAYFPAREGRRTYAGCLKPRLGVQVSGCGHGRPWSRSPHGTAHFLSSPRAAAGSLTASSSPPVGTGGTGNAPVTGWRGCWPCSPSGPGSRSSPRCARLFPGPSPRSLCSSQG